MLEQIFIVILLTSCIGTTLTMVLRLVKPITKKYFSSSWHYYMWLVVLIVMVLPVRFNLPAKSIPQPNAEISEVSEIITEEAVPAPDIIINNTEQAPDLAKLQEINETTQSEVLHTKLEAFKAIADNWLDVAAFIWVFGMLILLISKLIMYTLFVIRMNKNSYIVELPELAEFTDKRIITRKSDRINSPLMSGIFRPVLLLPQTEMTAKQLDNVLAHEITHFKRKDVLYKWFVSLIKCIHWFNPIIYYISHQINIECEISCDLAVTKNMSQEEKISYINTILRLLTDGNSKNIPLTTGMTGSKEVLKKRFTEIKNAVKLHKTATVVSVIAAFLILAGAIFISGILNAKASDDFRNNLANIVSDELSAESQNLLFLGVDEQGIADTIMILKPSDDGILGLSIPRNVMFNEDSVPERISDILSEENGEQKVIEAIRRKFSIPVRYYIKMELTALKAIIDRVGAVEFDVPIDMVYDDPYKDLHIDIKQGRQALNGEQICHLLQFRRGNDGTAYENGDLTRIEIGQDFIKEFIKQKLNAENLDKLPDIYKIISDNISTNLSPTDIKNSISNINGKNATFYTIPGINTTSDNGMFIYEIDYINAREILNNFGFNANISYKQSIPYQNEKLGFSLRLPSSWQDKYEVLVFDNQVSFLQKATFMKYGKGFGMLFYIRRINVSEIENVMSSANTAEPKRIIYQDDNYAYIFGFLSDVQYPVWVDSDEEDTEITKEYETMYSDILFIENSFTPISSPAYNAVDFTEEEINSARIVVEKYFKAKQEHNKEALLETLTDIYNSPNVVFWQDENIVLNNITFDMYDPKRKSYIETGRGSVNGTTYDNVIVFKVDYTVSYSENEKSAYNNGKYTNWSMILIRDNKNSPWRIDDMGY